MGGGGVGARQGKQLFFVTNNSTKSREGYLGKFLKLGLEITAEEIYSSSYAAAAYLESVNFPSDKKVDAPPATSRHRRRRPADQSKELRRKAWSREARVKLSSLHSSVRRPR